MLRVWSIAFLGWLCLDATASTSVALSRSEFDPGPQQPFGRPNPEAPAELAQFAFLIGRNDCTERRRLPNSADWVEGERTWDAAYGLDGYAVIDAGIASRGANGNVRIFDPTSNQWQVTFFSTPSYGSGVWSGGMRDGEMVLEQPQKAPGTELDGVSRLTFHEITTTSFRWRGEWASEDGSVVFPFWTIQCRKVAH